MASGRGSRLRRKRSEADRNACRKRAAVSPPRIPSSVYGTTSHPLAIGRSGTRKIGWPPKAALEMRVATTEENTSGAKTSSAKLPTMISIVNRAAPIGVL